MDKKMLLLVLAIGIIAVVMMQKKSVSYVAPVTGNANRDSKVAQILALVAGSTSSITAIAKAISDLTNSSDDQVQSYYNSATAGSGNAALPADWLA